MISLRNNDSKMKIKSGDRNNRWTLAQDSERKFWREHNSELPAFEMELESLKSNKIETYKKKILEIGSGATGIVNVIKGDRYAIDPLLDLFEKKFNLSKDIKYFKGKGEELPFENEFFNIVFCINALDHADNPLKVIKETNRCLKKGGIFFLTLNCYSLKIVFIKRLLERIGAGDIFHPHSYTPKEIKNMLIMQGFDVLKIEKNYILRETLLGNPRKSLIQKIAHIKKSRGLGYLFKRALFLPLYFIFTRGSSNYMNSFFICRKVSE